MTTTRAVSTAVLVTAFALANTALAQDKKPAAAVPAPAPAAAPAPKPMAAAPAPAPAAAPAPKPAAPAAAPAPAARAASPAAPAGPPAAAGAAPAAAAPPAAPPMPAPSKELEAFMKGFEGNWRCETKFPAGAMGPGSPEMTAKSTVKVKKEFGGMAWRGDYSLAKSKTMPAITGVFEIVWESGTNQAAIVGYDNMGSVTMGLGPLSGESVTFSEDGYMMGMKVKGRETMTKKGPKEILHKWEIDLGKGFQPMGEDACKK
ncbi:MAG: hypothetical protein ABUS79_03090 [Pseudomonadota bacterium]